MELAPATSSWLPPGGSWIFWQAALRNRLAKKPDEGWREVGSQMQLYEWHLLLFLPFNVEFSNFLVVATPHQSALPVPKSRHG